MIKTIDDVRWKKHPWAVSNTVALVPVHFLLSISNQQAQPRTNLACGKLVHEDEVWREIIDHGMLEPLLITVNKDKKTIRLESGNHRVRTANKAGVTHLPATVQAINDLWFSRGNGTHYYDGSDVVLWDNILKSGYVTTYHPENVLNIDFAN